MVADAATQPPPPPSKPNWADDAAWRKHAEPELQRWYAAERFGAVPPVLRPKVRP